MLQPGEMSLHHVLIVHGSEPNTRRSPRIGFAIRYVPTDVRQIAGEARQRHAGARRRHASTTSSPSCRPRPTCTRQRWRATTAIIDRQLRILYAGAAQPGKLGDAVLDDAPPADKTERNPREDT